MSQAEKIERTIKVDSFELRLSASEKYPLLWSDFHSNFSGSILAP